MANHEQHYGWTDEETDEQIRQGLRDLELEREYWQWLEKELETWELRRKAQ